MTASRQFKLFAAGTAIPLPCFFPSVSSVKTNLMPVDYVELLAAVAHPVLLVSAYDIATSCAEHRQRIDCALKKSRDRGSTILLDSGNYEGFWKGDVSWQPQRFHEICKTYTHHLCFCYDNQEPPDTGEAIANDVVASVLRDQDHALGTVVPILHGPADLLPAAARSAAEQLCPVLLAVPERSLGEGIAARARTVRRIRSALDSLGSYCPLHLLGTGNPLSIMAYAMAGADSFDGLEWCQTVVDHRTGVLFHFQHWDFFRDQTEWGTEKALPYIQSVLMHNLRFYSRFMQDLRTALESDAAPDFLRRYLSGERAETMLRAIEGCN